MFAPTQEQIESVSITTCELTAHADVQTNGLAESGGHNYNSSADECHSFAVEVPCHQLFVGRHRFPVLQTDIQAPHFLLWKQCKGSDKTAKSPSQANDP